MNVENNNSKLSALGGVFPPLCATYGADGEIDVAKYCENIARYNAMGLGGYVVNGSTGESVLLRWTEVERLCVAAREAASPGKILIAGTGAESTAETIEMTRMAARIGMDYALVRTPSFYKPVLTDELQAEHFLRVADASKIPVLIYSVPMFTGYAAEAPLVARLASHPNIAGMKDSSGDAARAKAILAAVPEKFRLLVGSATLLAQMAQSGAAGAILAMACAFPELCVAIYEAAMKGDAARAESLQAKLSAATGAIARYGIPGIKSAMDARGFYGGASRRPLLPLKAEGEREVRTAVANTVV